MKRFEISGMSCAACSARVERAVSRLEGVDNCSVNLLTNSMTVEGSADNDTIISAVISAGYGACVSGENKSKIEKGSGKGKKNAEARRLLARFLVSLVFLLVLMYFSMGNMMWGWRIPAFFEQNHLANGILQMSLTIIIMVINGRFFISGFRALFGLSPNMDTLVSIGAGASFIYSTYVLFTQQHYIHDLYFESAAMILTLITLGKMLEAIAKGRTTDALQGLSALAPEYANVLRDGKETKIPVGEVQIGDIFVLRPGESVPCDAIIVEGESALDESTLTGESIPVDKGEGDSVFCATINQSGFLKCEVTGVGEGTALSRIIQMVSDASSTKAPIAKVADKVSGIFVPIVICIALVTFGVWLSLGESVGYALSRGISVLVISCPCALGLATPVSVMVGNGIGAKNGILFKNAEALEETGKIKTVALDKTGTVTLGQPKVTDIIPVPEAGESELLTVAFSLERQSEHPLARAIVSYCEENGLKELVIDGFTALSGNGLCALLDGDKIVGGSLKYMGESYQVSKDMKDACEILASSGKTPMLFARGERLLGVIAVADVVKEESSEAIRQLRKMGIRTLMITGDNERTAKAIAKASGIDEVIAEVLPEGKEKAIRDLKTKGKTAMVGDGINDAIALTSADIGIAIGNGTDIAIDAADVILMKSNMLDLPAAIRLSRKTLKNIHLSLFWAFFYNTIGIPVAAGALVGVGITLNPMLAAAAMSLSSFCVVCNARRLNFFNIYKIKEKKKMEKTIYIEGMMCPHCEAHVKKALEALSGVELAEASHKDGTARLTLVGNVDNSVLKKTVEDAGYTVKDIK